MAEYRKVIWEIWEFPGIKVSWVTLKMNYKNILRLLWTLLLYKITIWNWYYILILINLAIDPNRVPEVYESRLVANEDYSNDETGGLSFQSGDTVWLLLRNQNGWLVIAYIRCHIKYYYLEFFNYITLFITSLFRCTGMSNGEIGTFQEFAVSEYGKFINYN